MSEGILERGEFVRGDFVLGRYIVQGGGGGGGDIVLISSTVAPSWIGQADDSGDEFWKITKYITGFAVCPLWCFVYE